MPRTGRPAKPIEEKRRLGNPGQRRLPTPIVALAPVVKVEVVAQPGSGTDLVQSILDAGASTWVGVTDRLALLQLLADAWDERLRLRAFLAEHGTSYQSFSKVSGGQWHDRPEVRQLSDLEKRLTTWLSLLGLTPTDRSRLGVAEVKARTKLEELRDRRESRAGRHAG